MLLIVINGFCSFLLKERKERILEKDTRGSSVYTCRSLRQLLSTSGNLRDVVTRAMFHETV